MTEGLITRIGRWMDRKWEAKATESQVEDLREEVRNRWSSLENSQIKDKGELKEYIQTLSKTINGILERLEEPAEKDKELADLKTRMEKMELYSGMTRKVDPTKPPVVKSAFQM